MEIRRNLEQYLMVFPTNFYPVMGQQITLTEDNADVVDAQINLLMARAELGECDLVARGKTSNGYLYQNDGTFKTNVAADKSLTAAKLHAKAKKGATMTYTCTPPGSGVRIALDRDEDGALDGDEIAAGTNPADPASVPVI